MDSVLSCSSFTETRRSRTEVNWSASTWNVFSTKVRLTESSRFTTSANVFSSLPSVSLTLPSRNAPLRAAVQVHGPNRDCPVDEAIRPDEQKQDGSHRAGGRQHECEKRQGPQEHGHTEHAQVFEEHDWRCFHGNHRASMTTNAAAQR